MQFFNGVKPDFLETNALNNALDLVINRNSHAKLGLPAPTQEEQQLIFQSALRAPDHAMIKPWQYLVVEGDNLIKLGEIMAKSNLRDNPDATEAELTKLKNAPSRAPLVVIAIAKPVEHPKVPRSEQIISAGCGVHQMLLAAEALGYAGIWRTGPISYSKSFHQALSLNESDEIVGFLYLGTAQGNKKRVQEFSVADYFQPLDLG